MKDRAQVNDREQILRLWKEVNENRESFLTELNEVLELWAMVHLYKREYRIKDLEEIKNTEKLFCEIAFMLKEYCLALNFNKKQKVL